jgi:ABC-type branched-subunit amino acid transport system ATPase component
VTDQPPAVLETVALRAGYTDVNILHDVSISVPAAGIVAVIGPNGAGKSTLLKAVYGLLKARGGKVFFRTAEAERDITGMRPNHITALGMNYVPQLDNVFANMTVWENLEMGAYLRPDAFEQQIDKVVSLFPRLKENRRQRAATLSGGERHMLALARALMMDPRLLLLDEPSAGLAPAVVDEVFAKIAEINSRGIAMVIVEQNARRSLALANYAYVLDMGRSRFEGPGEELLNDPKVVDLYLGGRGRLAAARVFTEDYEADREKRS